MSRLTWLEYGMELAKTASLRSEDPYVQVGCCILRPDNSIASLGYNGAPPGVDIDWSDRDDRRKRVIHAETNALRFIKPGEGDRMFVTLMPCSDCLKNAASYGINKIFYNKVYNFDTSAKDLAQEFRITLQQIT
tara:strand:- start:2647 stop:3048 length:402 start_codon:yes stop_codon:yes gene_type:complete